jgi:hypothetical protein
MEVKVRVESRITSLLEIIVLFAFGISWLAKGGAVFKEEKKA